MSERMDGGELQTAREFLGLTIEVLAGLLSVNPRTVRSWEAGREPIPGRIRSEVAQIEETTRRAVSALAGRADAAGTSTVTVYRSDDDFRADVRLATAYPGMSARWWRHVVARAREQAPGLVVNSA